MPSPTPHPTDHHGPVALLPIVLGAHHLGVDALTVVEILGPREWVALPNTPPLLRGAVAWRGRAVAFFDLGPALSQPPLAEPTTRVRNVVLRIGDETAVISVDSVLEIPPGQRRRDHGRCTRPAGWPSVGCRCRGETELDGAMIPILGLRGLGGRTPGRKLMRVLVLDGASVAVPDHAIESIESIESIASASDPASAWLPALLFGVASAPTPGGDRRTLRLRGGGAVDVPAAMHFIDDVELLELPGSLQPRGRDNDPPRAGVLGIIELQDGLYLVCEPRELVALARSRPPSPPQAQAGR